MAQIQLKIRQEDEEAQRRFDQSQQRAAEVRQPRLSDVIIITYSFAIYMRSYMLCIKILVCSKCACMIHVVEVTYSYMAAMFLYVLMRNLVCSYSVLPADGV